MWKSKEQARLYNQRYRLEHKEEVAIKGKVYRLAHQEKAKL
jgi:hypothetical protein